MSAGELEKENSETILDAPEYPSDTVKVENEYIQKTVKTKSIEKISKADKFEIITEDRRLFQLWGKCGSYAISYAPTVFLSLAEANSGELDFQIFAASWSSFSKVNYTKMKDVLGIRAEYTTPRISNIKTVGYMANRCTGFSANDPNNNIFTYEGPKIFNDDSRDVARSKNITRSICYFFGGFDCASNLCSRATSLSLYFINSTREKHLEIGRSWPYPTIPRGSCYVHQVLSRTMGVAENDYIIIPVDLSDVFPLVWENAKNKSGGYSPFNQQYVNLLVRVDKVIRGNYGKLPAGDGAVVYMEMSEIFPLLQDQISPMIQNETFTEALQGELAKPDQLEQQATNVIFNCDEFRVGCYMSTDYESIAQNLINWASSIVYDLDFTRVDSTLSVLENLSGTQVVSAFLNLIFSIVVLMMGGLSIFLIYSLLMVSVETRTFEMGVFRMVGLSKLGLILMILIQSLMYAVPGWSIGLIAAQCSWLGAKSLLATLLNTSVAPLLTANAILISTLLGLVVPIVAAILPIRQALTNNLHDSLDTRRSKTKAVILTIERSRGQIFSPVLLIVGTLLTVMGLAIYYLLPLSLLYNNITLLFNIFLALLVGMLLGLVMLSLNLQPLIERGLVWLFFQTLFRMERRSMPKLVVKNLIAHRMRNRKTAIMYALALGFIIFLTVGIRIQLESLVYDTRKSMAADIVINSRQAFPGVGYVPFEAYCNQNPKIVGFSYATPNYEFLNQSVSTSENVNIGRTVALRTSLAGISPNFLDLPDNDLVVIDSRDPALNPTYTVSEQLYLQESFRRSIVGSLYITSLSLDSFNKQFMFRVGVSKSFGTIYDLFQMRPSAFMDSCPVYTFSQYPSVETQDTITSFLSYMAVFNGTIPSLEMIPIYKMFIKLTPNADSSDLNNILADLTAISSGESIMNLEFELAGIRTAQQTLVYIFQIVTIAAMIVAFFSLNSSMYTNITEQKMEIGVLRALGLQRNAIFRLFVYEAFFLVLGASVLGTFIGVTVGWTMAAQRSVMTSVPLVFIFPWDIFLLVMGVGLLCAIFATIGPILRLVYKRPIIALIKG